MNGISLTCVAARNPPGRVNYGAVPEKVEADAPYYMIVKRSAPLGQQLDRKSVV